MHAVITMHIVRYHIFYHIGTSQMKPAANGKVGICLLLIILCNSLVAVSVGLLASIIIEPGWPCCTCT